MRSESRSSPSRSSARFAALAALPALMLVSAAGLQAQESGQKRVSASDAEATPSGIIDSQAYEIVRTAERKKLERWEGVENYTVFGTVQGNESIRYYERIDAEGRPAFRLVPPTEYEGEELEEAGLGDGFPAGGETPQGFPSADGLLERAGGDGLLGRTGSAAADAATGGLQQGLARRGMEALFEGTQDDGTDDATSEARTEAVLFEAIGRTGRLSGEETVDGRRAYLLVADDLSDVDLGAASGEDVEARISSARIWLDAEQYVPLRTEMELETAEGTPPTTIEILDRDYRSVDGLYEPFQRVIVSRGLLQAFLSENPEKQKEMQEAAKKLEEVEKQLEQLPPEHRQMAEAQFRIAREQYGRMAAGEDEGSRIEMHTEEIVVNEGPPLRFGRGTISVTGAEEAEIPRTIVSFASGPDPAAPGGDGHLSTVQLMGAVEGEVSAILQLSLQGEPSAGSSLEGGGALLLRRSGSGESVYRSEPGAAPVRIISRTSRHVRGEFSFEATEPSRNPGDAAVDPRAVTVEGSFEARVPNRPPAGPSAPGLDLQMAPAMER